MPTTARVAIWPPRGSRGRPRDRTLLKRGTAVLPEESRELDAPFLRVLGRRHGMSPAPCCLDRHREEKGGPFPRIALDPDASSMRFHDPLRDREPEPYPTPVAFSRLPVPVEHMRELLRRDPRPGVGN
jgi:hypothetical protein